MDMGEVVRLAVLQTAAEVFSFAIRKFPELVALTVVAAVIVEPLMFLALQFTGGFAAVAFMFDAGGTTNSVITSTAGYGRALLIVLAGIILFFALVSVPIIRHITHNERLWLIRINRSTPRYMLYQIPVILILAVVVLVVLMIMTGYDSVLSGSLGAPGSVILVLGCAGLILACYFGARFSLIPVAAVASDSSKIGHGFELSRGNGFRLVMVFLLVGIPNLIIGLFAMDKVFLLYATYQESLAAVNEPDAANIFNGGPRQILELYGYIFSKPAFIAANSIVFLFLSLAVGSMLGVPAIAYRNLVDTFSK
jgi:hypothetical protein